jgi:signal transduction histidine kinase
LEMTDAERVLQVLIHDIRTPVGVAQGYVRLIREERLETAEERDRALSRALDALSRIARLCDDASGFLPAGHMLPFTAVSTLAFVSAVEARVHDCGFAIDRSRFDPHARVRMRVGTERLGDAVGTLLATVCEPRGATPPTLRIATTATELELTAARTAESPSGVPAEMPFDGWSVRGLAVPAACYVIADNGGQVRQAGRTLLVALPLEIAHA